MKVLHIIGNANFGGIENLVITLVHQQISAGKVSPGILFTNMRGDFLEKFRKTGAPLFSMDCRRGYDVSIKKYKSAMQIFSDFDLLHFHFFNPFLAFCATRSNKPVVYTIHGGFGFGRKATLSDYIKKRPRIRFLNNHVHYITFNSEFTKKTAEHRYGLHEAARSVVYNGLNTGEIKGNPDHIQADIGMQLADKFVVGTSSRLAGFKCIDRLITAFSEFQKGKHDVVLLVVGDGVMRQELEDLVTRLGIKDTVIFAGFRENVHDYQCAMDVCVFPSRNEPFGLVAIECFLLGKPTLVFNDAGGMSEIVGGFSEADVVSDINMLSRRIDHYYKNRIDLEDRGDLRRHYGARFNAVDMEAEFCSVYEKVIIDAA